MTIQLSVSAIVGYKVVDGKVIMIARSDSPVGTNAQYNYLTGKYYSNSAAQRSYDSRVNGTGSITFGGREIGTNWTGSYCINIEGIVMALIC
ncbi:hypothetical protein FJO98_13735 [Enterococcus sp. PF-2]|jgi:hypothetical protein|uniref:hypothetical protein n=1 Tax=Enterococcus TaxID=1350 RepID=UPI000DF9DD62|nr:MULTISPECIES: hypothetical protein [Enterococcus]TPE00673.1 hypothetical protein FJP08_14910 [Enterococcus sp. PF-3]TPE24142.1 hypothetical protein FJO98_13735 [Enterococcus sp. PF-2]GEB30355.1 hypothetical protein ECA02_34500 [Enterococcus casseliflavus]STP32871.1 Uncharacterised protein [Enterococcus casseliflavus]